MKAAGVIAEYNPLHLGHLRQLTILREQLGDRPVVVCMSGDFVQRGEPAIFSKYARAEAAVRTPGGADLVLELQTPFSMSRAQRFAEEGVRILSAAGVVDTLCFGTECGDLTALQCVAEALESAEFPALLAKELESGSDFASARQRSAARLIGADRAGLLEQPNNILGVEYLLALQRQGTAMRPMALQRTGAEHDAPAGEHSDSLSASALRDLLRAGEWQRAGQQIPAEALAVYRREYEAGRGPMGTERLEQALLSRLRQMSPETYARLPDLSEGLEHRLYDAAEGCSFAEICAAAKTKRYSMARIRRLLLSACLGLDEQTAAAGARYLRVLAMNERGRELLREMRGNTSLPVIVKPSDTLALDRAACQLAETESRACDFYTLGYKRPERRGSDFRVSPTVCGIAGT